MIFEQNEDLPILKATEDIFDRSKIVATITKIINSKTQKEHSCFTIGIYGKWGEGKTSILNLIEEQLQSNTNIVISKFNPWFFKDQESILLDFFNSINGTDIGIDFINKLKQYGPIASMGISGIINMLIPGLGNLANNATQSFLEKLPSLEINPVERKLELNKIIKKSGKHLVVFVDDVDRLDKKEIHTLFKLIKQVANFSNTIFIIAMDKDIVAKSLASEFEYGEAFSGYNFLEKIIQLQIYLPQLQQGQLLQLLENKLDNIFLELQNQESNHQEYIEAKENIFKYVLPLISTAREVIQYTNILSVSLLQVMNEVNISDLCLLESLKVVYPYGYEVIRKNRHIILQEDHGIFYYIQVHGDLKKQIQIEEKEREDFIQKILQKASSHQLFFLKNLIHELLYNYLTKSYNTLEIDEKKRLCSKQYYDKYFMFGVPQDIISESLLLEIIQNIKLKDSAELAAYFDNLLYKYDDYELGRNIYQIIYRRYRLKITNIEISKICISLSQLTSNNKRSHFTEFNGMKRWEFTIIDILNQYINKNINGEYIKDFDTILKTLETISNSPTILFSVFCVVEFKRRGFGGYDNVKKVNKIIYNIIKRFISEKSEKELFNLGEICIDVLFNVWKNYNNVEYESFISRNIGSVDFDIIKLVNTFIYNQEKKYYAPFIQLFNKDLVYDSLKKLIERNSEIIRKEKDVVFFIKIYEEEKERGL